MSVNDLAESSFAGVTSQLQVFGLIWMSRADAISDMARSGFLGRPTTNKDISDNKTRLFHDSQEELHITAIMCALQEATATRQSNIDAMDRHRNDKQERDNTTKREVLDKAIDEFIQCIICRYMWDSDRRQKTDNEVKKEVRALKLKREKESSLNDNIQMHYKGLGRLRAKTTWSKNGKKKTIPKCQDRLIEIIKLTKQWNIPDETHMTATQRI